MRFTESPLAGAFVIEIQPHEDTRGLFARTWCRREFAAHGLPTEVAQESISCNRHRGTVRGMHLQLPPSHEAKLVRCTRGAIYDVIVDLRPGSPTYLCHFGIELTERNHLALHIPPLLAHGFQTLLDETEVLYRMTDFHAPELTFGLRWNDPAFAIRWPVAEGIVILPRDASYPDFDPGSYLERIRHAASGAQHP